MSPRYRTHRNPRRKAPASQFYFHPDLTTLEDRTTPDASYWNLANEDLTQDWTDTSLISSDDNWTNVPSIMGFRGDNLTKFTAVNPQTVLTEGTSVIDINANRSDPDTYTTGGVTEFELVNPTIAIAGTTTADAPNIVLYLNTTGVTNVVLSYRVRDIDASADIASQPLALQYRIGEAGDYTDIPDGYISDATAGPNRIQSTPFSITLPASLNNQPQVQIRFITTNAVGNDEWLGIDDIVVSSTRTASTFVSVVAGNAIQNEGNTDATPYTFTVNRTGDTTGTSTVDYTVSGSGTHPANANDFFDAFPTGSILFPPGETTKTITINVSSDLILEPDEQFDLTIYNPTGSTITSASASGTILNDDTSSIRINEVDSDTPGFDSAEFVELYDGGIGNIALDNLVIVFFDGTNNQSYAAFDLDGYSTNAQGFFVLGNSAIAQSSITFNNNLLINDAAAVAIYCGTASEFPANTPVVSDNLIDAIVYGTDNNNTLGLISVLTPGQLQIYENVNSRSDTESISRVPDGGIPRDTSNYIALLPTPGALNIPPNTPPNINLSTGTRSYTEGNAPIYPILIVDNLLTIADNGTLLSGATVYFSSGYVFGQDSLTGTEQGNITVASFDPISGKLALTGNATLAEYEIALRSIAFSTGDNPGDGDRGITFIVTDSEGVASTPQTRIISVSSVNDAVSIYAPSVISTIEDDTINISGISIHDPDSEYNDITLSISSRHGTIFINNSKLTSEGTNDSSQFKITGLMSDINTALQTLSYNPIADYYGDDVLSITADDRGYSGNGTSSITVADIPITIIPVNDSPSFVGGNNVSIVEDAGSVSIPGWATDLTPGPNENGQSLLFRVTCDQPTLFAVTPSITNDGTLNFTPVHDAYGTAAITVILSDDAGGNDSSSLYIFTITIIPINDQPSFVSGPNQTVLEDCGTTIIPAWATDIISGPNNESTQNVSFVITADHPSLFADLRITPSGDLRFTPTANAYGSATIAVQILDDGESNTDGTNISGIQYFTITILPVNDAPSFTLNDHSIHIQSSLESQSIVGFATDIVPGPLNELDQSLTFSVSQISEQPTFLTMPTINPNGTLTITPNEPGTATFLVTLHEDGSNTNGGINAYSQTFTLAVLPPPIPPIGMADTFLTPFNSILHVIGTGLLNNDDDPDSPTLFVTHVSELSPVGAGTLSVMPDGNLKFIPTRGFSGMVTFTYQPTDGVLIGNITNVSITVGDRPPPINQSDVDHFAVGSGRDGTVTMFNRFGTPGLTIVPFPGSSPEVRVAVANGNWDTIPDLFVATGPGGRTRVLMIDGAGGRSQRAFTPFEDSFTGGAFIATADLDGDGFADLAISPDVSGGPRVVVFSGRTGAKLVDFFGINDPLFRGGTRLAFGDINGDGTPDLIVAAGIGGGPRVAVWDGVSVLRGQPRRMFNDFFAFEDTVHNGVFVASGDINGDGYDEILIGGGPHDGPRVIGLDGLTLVDTQGHVQQFVANFFAGVPNNRDGVRVAVKNLDDDNFDDLIVAVTDRDGPVVYGYYGKSIRESGVPSGMAFGPNSEPMLRDGIYVG